jgi:hypothetical protein
VVRDRPLREPDALGELGRRRRPFTQDRDDPEPDVVGERTQLLGLGDDEDVVGLVVRVGEIETVDGCRNIRQPSTVRKLYGTNVPSGPAGVGSEKVVPGTALPGTPLTASVEKANLSVANAVRSLFTSSA